MRASLLLVGAWLPVPATLFLGFTVQWVHIFTDDSTVTAMLEDLAPWLVAYISCDAVLAISNGGLSGSGQQGVGGRLALLSYVAISLPLSLTLGFGTSLAAVGLMGGHVVGKAVHSAASLWIVCRTQWGRQSELAIERVRQLKPSSTLPTADQDGGNGGDEPADETACAHTIAPSAPSSSAPSASSAALAAAAAAAEPVAAEPVAELAEDGVRRPTDRARVLRTGRKRGALRLPDGNDDDDDL